MVGQVEGFRESVRDVDDGDPLVAKAPHLFEQESRLGLVERRRGLVEDQQLHVLADGLGDLELLLLRDREGGHLASRVHVETNREQELLRGFTHGPAPHEQSAEPASEVEHEKVLGHVEGGNRFRRNSW